MRVLLAAVLTIAACGGGVAAPTSQPGSADVYNRIAASTDCAALQTEFNTADATNKREAAGSQQAKIALSYMQAADARMRELRCY